MAQAPGVRPPPVPPSEAPGAVPVPPGTPPPPATAPGRRTAWTEGVHRVRAAASTEPGRLRIIGAALAALVLAFGVLTFWQVTERADAADAVVDHSQPLSADAASIYRSLADANTTAADGFLAGVDERPATRARYDRDVRRASELMSDAAVNSAGSPSARRQIAVLNRELPRYTALVEAARANNRQGLPLGGAYLRYADERMRQHLLPAAKELYEAETAQLGEDYGQARSWPWFALAAGLLALGGLGWAQRRDFLRTNRVLNPGLVGAAAAVLVTLLWLSAGQALARSGLGDSDEQGARSLRALNSVWISSLQARGEENLWLVARGAGTGYEESYVRHMNRIEGRPDAKHHVPSLLDVAYDHADDGPGRLPVAAARDAVREWRDRHTDARTSEENGDHEGAVQRVVGGGKTTGKSFDRVDASLRTATGHEQTEFEHAAEDGRDAFTGLAAGAALLALLGAIAALLGIGRRLSEYR